MTTQGTALESAGNPLNAGTPIRTFVDGVDYSNHTEVLDAQGTFAVATAGNLVLNGTTPEPSPVKEGANLGELIVYAAGASAGPVEYFQETESWRPDATVSQDLHLGSAVTQPEPLRIQGIVTQPARGGPQYAYLCNPTAAPVSLADYYLQVDRPGTFYGGNLTLSGTVAANASAAVNLSTSFRLIPTGDALKLVYRNPGGTTAPARGQDVVIDRLEFNATTNGTLDWQPASTIQPDAPAPGPGQILERTSFCSSAPPPGGFELAPEPGLPAVVPPSVTITAPSGGQNVQGGQVFTFRWTMSDAVFVPTYLKVWVNVSYQGTTATLLAGALGATSVDWPAPDLSTSNAVVRVSVVNPFGAEGNATRTFAIVPATPYSAYIAILIVAVIAGFILLAYYYAHRQAGPPPESPPPARPPPTPPREAPAPGHAAEAAAGTKTCPACGTAVREQDEACFYCGHLFTKPPP